MNSLSTKSQIVSRFRYIGAGIVLSTIWWVLSVSSFEQFHMEMLESAVTALGGFVPAVIGMLWIGNRIASTKEKVPLGNRKTRIWLILSLIYPVAAMVALIWNTVYPKMWLTRLITHPVILILNLMAVFLIGPVMALTGFAGKSGAPSNQEGSGKGRELVLIGVYWLWHLPFIFVNSIALSKLNFSTPLLALYLVSILLLSYFITWGYGSKLLNKES